MIEAAEAVATFVAGRSRANTDTDSMLLFAVVRAVEIIGEAASTVSPETRAAVPAVPWAQIAAMRNRLIHAYFDINLDILWATVQDSLPSLIRSLEPAMTENEGA